MSNIRNPAAAVIIWSYKDRLTHEKSDENSVHEVHETVLNTLSLVSIKTNKSKSSPVGSFTFTLAPYKNWVDFITPGSWCAIMMTNEGLPQMDKDKKKAVQSELKFFGRITSVRGSVHVSPDGARQTLYVCEGEDWGSVFNSVLYVDPAARLPQDSAAGTAVAMLYSELAKDITEGNYFPTTTDNISALINLWGRQSNYIAGALDAVQQTAGGGLEGLIINPDVVFKMPDEAAKFLGINPSIASHLLDQGGLVTGVLDSYDKYKETGESIGIVDPTSVFGSHPIWGVIKDNTNEIMNELFCDLRWENGKPKLGLYKRVRPFLTRDAAIPNAGFDTSSSENLIASFKLGAAQQEAVSSRFENVRRVMIPRDDIISFDAGTNWRDKLNFVEVLPDTSQFQYNGETTRIDTYAKGLSQVHDQPAFGREGLKGASFTTRFYPVDDSGDPSFQNPQAWARILAQWYFNSHNYLNGTIEFVGQSEFIGVGDNIMVDSSIFGPKPNMNIKQLNSKNLQYFLLHVESLSHNFTINQDGARHWTTTVSYTRGVLTDIKGRPTDLTAVDLDTSKLNPKQERNDWNTVSTSSGKDGEADPDIKKVPSEKIGS